MMTYKYGTYPEYQIQNYKKKLHSLVHWLLIYDEENPEILDKYFDIVQTKLNGYNELMLYPTEMVEMMNIIESARYEFNNNCDHDKFRRLILDAHALIDKLPPTEDKNE